MISLGFQGQQNIMAKEPLDGGYVWYCHVCGDGPIGTSTHPACVQCGHARCGACKVTAA
ncbi:hypothetical protein EV356DRAFT_505524 [Viridothelium virens]|uniref:Uncharacterized protein n=1 Tax=Viridothelium virens TaxID=1048519 RepID=A0A6A6H221_VIRVR|nr:hypothetical protein EV356DRAFT_505524 [Viridothelium virens]